MAFRRIFGWEFDTDWLIAIGLFLGGGFLGGMFAYLLVTFIDRVS